MASMTSARTRSAQDEAATDGTDGGREGVAARGAGAESRLLHGDDRGDWLLTRAPDGSAGVVHRAAGAGGGEDRSIAIPDFFASDAPEPARDELVRLIGTLIEGAQAGEETS